MAPRASGRRDQQDVVTSSGRKKADPRVKHAAVHVVEALENRRMLSVAPAGLAYHWNHMPDVVRHQLAVYEYIDPEFQANLDAELAQYGLTPIAPEAGNLAGMPGDGKSRWHHHHTNHKVHHPHAKPHHRHGRDVGGSPSITDVQYDYSSSPHQITFTFDQEITHTDVLNDPNLRQAIKVIDLNTGQPIGLGNVSYATSLNQLTYQVTYPNRQEGLASGNYVAILNGSSITAANNPTLKMKGSDGVAGDSYFHNFRFGDADADQNGSTDIFDLNALIGNWGQSGANFSQGDFDYNGTVDIRDLNILLPEFNQKTEALGSPGALTATGVDATHVRLDWGASGDANVKSYDVYKDNVCLGHVASPGYTDDQADGQPHQYFVVAKDTDLTKPIDQTTTGASEVGGIVVARSAATVSGQFVYQNASPQQLKFAFNEDVSASWGTALAVINLKTGAPVTFSNPTYTASPSPTVTYDLPTPLPDANYVAILKSSQITNADGTKLLGSDFVAGDDYVMPFYFLQGHLAMDAGRTVTQTDHDTVYTASQSQPSVESYANGDVNYSGLVTSDDVNAAVVGMSVLELAEPSSPTVTSNTYTGNNSSSITISWTASSSPGVVYDVYRDDVVFARGVTSPQFTDTTPTTGLAGVPPTVVTVMDGDAADCLPLASTAPTVNV